MNREKNALTYETLESRKLLAGITVESINGLSTLVIDGANSDDTAEVRLQNNDELLVTLQLGSASESQTVPLDQVERIRFLGRSGNDTFTNFTDVDSAAFGHNGDDVLIGGNGNNWIQGGQGDDHIVGGDRNDNLRGRAGDDTIEAGRRHDRVFGGSGDDFIVGAAGRDFIQGNEGNDDIFGGNSDDRINGGDGTNTIQFDNSDGRDIAILEFSENGATVSAAQQQLEVSHSQGSNQISGGDVIRFEDVDRNVEDYFLVLSEIEEHSLDFLNDFRASNNRSELFLKSDLSEYAASHAQQALAPLGLNPTVQELNDAHSDLSDVEHLFTNGRSLYLENLGYLAPQEIDSAFAAELIHGSFLSSPSHRANMLNRDVTEIGVGVVMTSNGWYVNHNFFG